MYRIGSPNVLWEFKCITPYLPNGSTTLGTGWTQYGGTYSTAEGHFIAFGNTEEKQRIVVFGATARGLRTDHAYDRTTGSGWLGERRGHYTDALSKRSVVHLVHTETTSAFSPALDRL